MFYFTILLIISNILWENIDTILLLLCTTIYKIFISFCAPTIFECFIFFPFGNVGGSHMLWLFGLESGGREFGRHNKWVSGGWELQMGSKASSPPPCHLAISQLATSYKWKYWISLQQKLLRHHGQDRTGGTGGKKNNEKYFHKTLTAILLKSFVINKID